MSKGADPNSFGSTLAETFHKDSSAAYLFSDNFL